MKRLTLLALLFAAPVHAQDYDALLKKINDSNDRFAKLEARVKALEDAKPKADPFAADNAKPPSPGVAVAPSETQPLQRVLALSPAPTVYRMVCGVNGCSMVPVAPGQSVSAFANPVGGMPPTPWPNWPTTTTVGQPCGIPGCVCPCTQGGACTCCTQGTPCTSATYAAPQVYYSAPAYSYERRPILPWRRATSGGCGAGGCR